MDSIKETGLQLISGNFTFIDIKPGALLYGLQNASGEVCLYSFVKEFAQFMSMFYLDCKVYRYIVRRKIRLLNASWQLYSCIETICSPEITQLVHKLIPSDRHIYTGFEEIFQVWAYRDHGGFITVEDVAVDLCGGYITDNWIQPFSHSCTDNNPTFCQRCAMSCDGEVTDLSYHQIDGKCVSVINVPIRTRELRFPESSIHGIRDPNWTNRFIKDYAKRILTLQRNDITAVENCDGTAQFLCDNLIDVDFENDPWVTEL